MSEADIKAAEKPIKPKGKKTAGEIAYNRGVYTGIGFGINEISSLWITDQFVNGKNLLGSVPGFKTIGSWFSKEGFDKLSNTIAKAFNLAEKMGKDGKMVSPSERGGNTLLMITLLSGGTLLLLPMKWLEDNKVKLVQKTNHIIDKFRSHKLTQEQVDIRDAEVTQRIACSPRQSWGSMLFGRLIAVTSSVSTGSIVGYERNQKLMGWSEKKLTGSLQPRNQWNAKHRWARLVSVETYSCAISSIMLEIMSKLTAKHNAKPHDPEICEAIAVAKVTAKASEDTDTKDADCGCDGKVDKNFHAAKIQSQKIAVADGMQAMQF